jgi:hypothetical protein
MTNILDSENSRQKCFYSLLKLKTLFKYWYGTLVFRIKKLVASSHDCAVRFVTRVGQGSDRN